jgi:hypothetical protein
MIKFQRIILKADNLEEDPDSLEENPHSPEPRINLTDPHSLEEEADPDYLEEKNQCEDEMPVDDNPNYLADRRDPMERDPPPNELGCISIPISRAPCVCLRS